MTKQSLENLFSEENITSYSRACIDLALSMAQVKSDSFNFDTLVIPSRGAFPFFLGMTYALNKYRELEEVQSLYEQLSIQPMLAPLMPESCEMSTNPKPGGVNVLLIPFTADLSIKDSKDPSKLDDAKTTLYTGKTREYWARVTTSFFDSPDQRVMNPYFRTFTESVLQKVEHRRGVALNYLRFPKIQNFAMIDTVISGRAANEILRAFDAIAGERCYASNPDPDAVKPYAFLIVDEDGKKLWPQFKRYLDERPESLTERLPIPKIVSEDTGSSLLGVSAVVYPSLMEQSESFRYNGIEFFVGAGSWHIKNSGDNLFHFKQFMNMIYSGIDSLSSAQDSPEKARFAKTRQDYLDLAENIGLLDLEDNDIACNQYLRTLSSNLDQTYLTNSNVFHVKFKPELTRKLGYEICNFPGVTCAAPEEGKEKPHVKKKRTLRKKK